MCSLYSMKLENIICPVHNSKLEQCSKISAQVDVISAIAYIYCELLICCK